jgi:hypothetical protein
MQDEDDIPEFPLTQIAVEETNRLFRLTPTAVDLSKASRQIALVPANSEDDARRIATTSDPMGRDWRDVSLFTADSMETSERHVVGDVIFRSTPNPAAAPKRKA